MYLDRDRPNEGQNRPAPGTIREDGHGTSAGISAASRQKPEWDQLPNASGDRPSELRIAMALARSFWKGYLKLSLVSCPIAMFPASSRERVPAKNAMNSRRFIRTPRLRGPLRNTGGSAVWTSILHRIASREDGQPLPNQPRRWRPAGALQKRHGDGMLARLRQADYGGASPFIGVKRSR